MSHRSCQLLTADEARRIAANIAKLSELSRRGYRGRHYYREDCIVAKKKRTTKAKKARRKPNFAAFFAPEISRGLKLLAAETDTTVQALMAEALSDLFAKRGKYQLAQALRPAETAERHTDLSTGITDKD